MPPVPYPSPLFRAVFRRHVDQLRMSRLPKSAPRRLQSTNTNPNPAEVPKPQPKSQAGDPIPPASTPAVPLPLWQRLGTLTRIGQAYGHAHRKRPWATQIASALLIYLAADVSAQSIGGKEYVPERTIRNMAIGGVIAVPNFIWRVSCPV